MTTPSIDETFNLAISEIATILAGGHPSDVPLSSFGLYQEIVEMLREDYQNDPANIEKTWNFIKTLDIYAGLVVAVGQGWNDHPNRTLLSLPQILEVITTAGDESQVRMALINLRRDAAQLSNAELLQLTEIVENRLGISQTFIKDWRKLVTEIQKKTIAGNGFVDSGSARGAVPGGVANSGAAQPTPISFHLTDLGNAKRLVSNYGKDIRYVKEWGKWLVWNGILWEDDQTGAIERYAKNTVLGMYNDAANIIDDDKRRELIKWAHQSESSDRIMSMIRLAQTELGIGTKSDVFDKDDMLLNCRNGTVDLRTGTIKNHSRNDLITKCTNTIFDPDAECPIWLDFLSKIQDGNQETVDFLHRSIGYSLTGSIEEQCFFFMYGTGQNGKSTFSRIISIMLGSYAQKAPSEMLMAKQYHSSIPNDVARLPGVRFVLTSEVSKGKTFAEDVIKDLTGSDELTARFMRGEFFDFVPTHKIWIYGNYKPVIRGSDPAIWRRVRLIPFTVFIPPEERLKRMIEILTMELPGILNWAIQGCLAWQNDGMKTPEKVVEATNLYREEVDIIGNYLDERILVEDGVRTSVHDIYTDYTLWCIENGENAMNQRNLSQRLIERGFERKRSTGGVWVFEKMRLRECNDV